MGFFDDLGSFAKKITKTTPPGFKLPNWVKPGAKAVGEAIPGIVNKPFTPYEGEWTAPLSEQQTWSMGQLQNLLGETGNPDDLIDRYGQYFNPMLDVRFSAIDEATARAQQQQDAQRHMAGAFGDTGAGVALGEIEGGRQSAYDQAAFEAWDQAMRYAGIDIGNEMQGQQNTMAGLGQLFGEGQVSQQTEQHELDALFAEFMREDINDQERALIASQILKNLPQGQKTKGKPSLLAQGIGTLTDIASAGMAPSPTR